MLERNVLGKLGHDVEKTHADEHFESEAAMAAPWEMIGAQL